MEETLQVSGALGLSGGEAPVMREDAPVWACEGSAASAAVSVGGLHDGLHVRVPVKALVSLSFHPTAAGSL